MSSENSNQFKDFSSFDLDGIHTSSLFSASKDSQKSTTFSLISNFDKIFFSNSKNSQNVDDTINSLGLLDNKNNIYDNLNFSTKKTDDRNFKEPNTKKIIDYSSKKFISDRKYIPFLEKFQEREDYFNIKSIPMYYSEHKKFNVGIKYKNDNNKINFPLYRDQDIGINEEYQKYLIENSKDYDVKSQSEDIDLGISQAYSNLDNGKNLINEYGLDNFVNAYKNYLLKDNSINSERFSE